MKQKEANYSPEANINLLADGRPCLRQLEYMSPTSMSQFFKQPNDFYLERIAPQRRERYPQTPAMAVGSAFDAYIKAMIAKTFKSILVDGEDSPYTGDMFDYDDNGVPKMLFTSVDSHNWEFAITAGQVCLDAYLRSTACHDLVARLEKAKSVHMESSLMKVIDNVPIMGKPDLAYIDEHGRKIILDWKVNGYCGQSKTRPTPGHLLHPKAIVMDNKSFSHNIEMPKSFYAYRDQVTTYGWLLGTLPNENIFCAIDQLTCNDCLGSEGHGHGTIDVYQHRYIVSESAEILSRYKRAWEILNDYDLTVEYFGDIVNVPAEIAMER